MAAQKDLTVDERTAKRPMSANELAALGGRRLVYIRAVAARDVIDDLSGEFAEFELDLEEDATLYSVHSADGERIALVGDRDLAFAAARQHEMNPVSVH